MLPDEICRKIFTYCDDLFFDLILKSNDTTLVNYLGKLGLYKVILYRHSKFKCILNYEGICDWIDKFYIRAYRFKKQPYTALKYPNDVDEIKYRDGMDTIKYIPYHQKDFAFEFVDTSSFPKKTIPVLYNFQYYNDNYVYFDSWDDEEEYLMSGNFDQHNIVNYHQPSGTGLSRSRIGEEPLLKLEFNKCYDCEKYNKLNKK